jgi:hypothetical protein
MVRPVRAFVDPAANRFDLLVGQHLFGRHLLAGGAIEDASIEPARGAVARNDGGPQHAGHGATAAVDAESVLLLLRPVALVAMFFEQRLDVAREVDGGGGGGVSGHEECRAGGVQGTSRGHGRSFRKPAEG